MSIELTRRDEALLAGSEGPGVALAMRVLARTAEAMGARHFLDIVSAHVDGCLFHGQAGLDFARALVEGGAAVVVPTTLNVSSLDLLHPDLVRVDPGRAADAAALMEAYTDLGCHPTWTCAPYQLPSRPAFGDQIAWAESNAIVFANSVLGARTERYGDFLDICAAVTGRAPAVGLHMDEGRRATLVVSVEPVADLCDEDAFYPLLGHVLGQMAGSEVAAIVGLPPDTDEDRLKAIGAGAASTGSVGMFHAVGITPEAPDLVTATAGETSRQVLVNREDLDRAVAELSTIAGGRVDAVSLGTPHYSASQLRVVASILGDRRLAVPLYVSTARHVLDEVPDVVEMLAEAGVTVVTDTCTYVTPILDPTAKVVMTDSAKWAYYAPANIGVDVVFGSLQACVEAATTGRASMRW
ncbi:MAG: aconitase X [Acidimicrobiia bacterium]